MILTLRKQSDAPTSDSDMTVIKPSVRTNLVNSIIQDEPHFPVLELIHTTTNLMIQVKNLGKSDEDEMTGVIEGIWEEESGCGERG